MNPLIPRLEAKRSPRQGYTLIELLTVIAIISVLASLLFAAIGTVKETAKRAKAKAELQSIVAAIHAYYTEYGIYPVRHDQEGSEVTYSTDNSDLMNVLRDIPKGANADHLLNPRRIAFLQIPETGNGRIVTPTGCWLDPWGPQQGKPESGVYHVRIDAAYSHQVTNPYPGDADEAGEGAKPTIDTDVIAWSLAKGGVQTYELRDQIISWQ